MRLDRPQAPNPYDFLPAIPELDVSSADIATGQDLSLAHAHKGAGGDNLSPHLRWSGMPAGTKAIAVTCLDPDAPTGSGAWHWVLVNVPVGSAADGSGELARGAGTTATPVTNAFHIRNDLGGFGYDGAAPPPGDRPHRYIYAVHALDAELPITPDTSAAFASFHITAHALARGLIVPVFAA